MTHLICLLAGVVLCATAFCCGYFLGRDDEREQERWQHGDHSSDV